MEEIKRRLDYKAFLEAELESGAHSFYEVEEEGGRKKCCKGGKRVT